MKYLMGNGFERRDESHGIRGGGRVTESHGIGEEMRGTVREKRRERKTREKKRK